MQTTTTPSARCPTCHNPSNKFYCVSCLRAHLRDFRNQIHRASTEREIEVDKAKRALAGGGIEQRRVVRADSARLEESVLTARREVDDVRRSTVATRQRLQKLRNEVSTRRANLTLIQSSTSQPNTQNGSSLSPSQDIQRLNELLALAHASLARTRRVLIQELISVFDVSHTSAPLPTHPSLPFAIPRARTVTSNHSSGPTQTIWTIASLPFPVPLDFPLLSPEHAAGVIGHTLHFIRLLTFYLGVKLPFEVLWDGGLDPSATVDVNRSSSSSSIRGYGGGSGKSVSVYKDGFGKPWIRAGKGVDHGGWAKETKPHPLHPLPSTSKSPSQHSSALAMGLTMLNFNVAYLLHTQGIDILLNATGETLRNLISLCASGRESIGTQSHLTPHPLHTLQPPVPATFPLEFAQLLQIQNPPAPNNTPTSTRRISLASSTSSIGDAAGGGEGEGEGEWDLVEAELEDDIDPFDLSTIKASDKNGKRPGLEGVVGGAKEAQNGIG